MRAITIYTSAPGALVTTSDVGRLISHRARGRPSTSRRLSHYNPPSRPAEFYRRSPWESLMMHLSEYPVLPLLHKRRAKPGGPGPRVPAGRPHRLPGRRWRRLKRSTSKRGSSRHKRRSTRRHGRVGGRRRRYSPEMVGMQGGGGDRRRRRLGPAMHARTYLGDGPKGPPRPPPPPPPPPPGPAPGSGPGSPGRLPAVMP